MHYLRSDEAWDTTKWFQSIASVLIHEEWVKDLSTILDQKLQKLDHTDLKFSRVRTNAGYVEMVNEFLTTFLDALDRKASFFVLCSGTSTDILYGDMYEEILLLTQWKVDNEITFCPDANNMMKRYDKLETYKEYGVVQIQEQDSKSSSITQVMDIIAGCINFLREYHGTYRARTQSENRYEQLDDFDRELHFRCLVTEHLLTSLGEYIGEIRVLETWLLHIESEQCLMLDY